MNMADCTQSAHKLAIVRRSSLVKLNVYYNYTLKLMLIVIVYILKALVVMMQQ